MSSELVLVYCFGVLLLYGLARLFVGPLRVVLRFMLYFCLGIAFLYAGNLVGRFLGATIAINPYTVMVAGFLNLPGVALLFVLRYWLRF